MGMASAVFTHPTSVPDAIAAYLLTGAGGTAPWLTVKSVTAAYSNSSYWLY